MAGHPSSKTHPEIVSLFVKPQTPSRYRDALRGRFGDAGPPGGE